MLSSGNFQIFFETRIPKFNGENTLFISLQIKVFPWTAQLDIELNDPSYSAQ